MEPPSLDDDDRQSVVSEKALLSEGMRSALRLLFQLCPSTAAEAPPQPQRAFEFEGLFSAVPKPVAGKVPTNLFHCVAELLSKAWMQGSCSYLVFLLAGRDQGLVWKRRCVLRLCLTGRCFAW